MRFAHAGHRAVLALMAFAMGGSTAVAERRTWTDGSGKFSIEAELTEAKPSSVVLKKADGSTIEVPLAQLSKADREHVQGLAKPNAKLPNGDGARMNLAFPDALIAPPAWNDANTPFDMAAFLKSPPPEENAAPLYLEALYEFGPGDMVDILFPNLSLEELKKKDDKFRPRTQEQSRLEDAWDRDPKSVDRKAVDAWLANYDLGFEKLAAAQQRPACIFQPGRSFHSLWPHNQAARSVGNIIVWRARRDLEQGNLERPLADLKTLLRLSRDLRPRGAAVAQLVSVALDAKCCELVRMILNAPDITTQQCDRLLALLAENELKTVDAFVEGNKSEYITSRQALHDAQHRTGTFDPKLMKKLWMIEGDMNSPLAFLKVLESLVGKRSQRLQQQTARLTGALSPGAWQGGKLLADADYAKEVAAMNQHYAAILAVAAKPKFLHQGATDLKAADALINETVLTAIFIPAETAFFEAIRRNKASLRCTQCLVALKRWQLGHPREAPADLAAIVKAAGMARVPIDPYSDEPLRLGVVAGKPVIYSVGADGKDDKAQVEWDRVPNRSGDFIFSLEKSLE